MDLAVSLGAIEMKTSSRFVERQGGTTHCFLVSLGVALLMHNSSLAQVKFDVKTTMDEKEQLHVIKLAVSNALRQSNWAQVAEIGEQYSLWLTSLKRSSAGDSIYTELDLDLRTPAMITRGKHISSRRVSVAFDSSSVSNVQTPNDSLMNALLVQALESSGMLQEFTKSMSSSIPFGGFFLNSFISNVLKELNRQPTPLECYEANLLAARVVIELPTLIAAPYLPK
jgi:hypothetical protein